MKQISIMGCLVSNSNLGCVALTYSILNIFEKISKEINESFTYVFYEHYYDENSYKKMCQVLNVDFDRVKYSPIGCSNLCQLKRFIWRFPKTLKMISNIKESSLVIDLTQGDSFTDIYGLDRFNDLTDVKLVVEKLGVPLILGPQTYGPFIDKGVMNKAKKVIENAYMVISRDEKSREYLSTFCNQDILVATDLAFGLPYKSSLKKSNKIKVGLNPSGLLFSQKTEPTEIKFDLSVDYDKYLDKIINKISNDERYELHLIPHVGNDAVPYFKDRNNIICHNSFSNPIEAKNLISGMDVFIGSRMHATIAAFSSGVATIPVAYSRKFSGLFNNIGYNNVVELNGPSTDEAVDLTLAYLSKYLELKEQVKECMNKVSESYGELYNTLRCVCTNTNKE